MVEDLEKLRQKLGYDQWVVLGLSFGGVVAQIYALKYPESLKDMILLSSALPASIDIDQGSRQYDFISEKEKKRIGQIYSIGGERILPLHSDQATPEMQKKMIYNAFMNGDWKRRHLKKWTEDDMAKYVTYEFIHDKNYYSNMMKDYFEYDLKGAFKKFPIPTMIIEGKWDLVYSADKAQIMFDQFPNAKSVFFENSGHIPYEDEPVLFLKN